MSTSFCSSLLRLKKTPKTKEYGNICSVRDGHNAWADAVFRDESALAGCSEKAKLTDPLDEQNGAHSGREIILRRLD
jgi:hypothetical protein